MSAPELPIGVVGYDRTARPDGAIAEAVRRLQARGLRVEGLVQEPKRSDSAGCALLSVEDIATGRRVQIFNGRGAGARGCRLDAGGLATAAVWLREAIERRPEVLFVNRFGRQEADGRGLYAEIAEAIASGIPVIVAVADVVMSAWQAFADGTGTAVANDAVAIERWCTTVATTGCALKCRAPSIEAGASG